MSDSKVNYEISRALMATLPPIKEESSLSRLSSAGGSPRYRQHVFVDSKHAIIVQTLPPGPNSFHRTPVFEPEPPVVDALDQEVDHVVADYLHYARYSATVPVKPDDWNPDETLYCPCCSQRNNENIRLKNGLVPVRSSQQPAIKADDSLEGSLSPEPVIATTLPSDSKAMHLSHKPVILSDASWMAYQPLPYATSYLNAEFNRPTNIEQYVEAMKGEHRQSSIKAEVMESNHKFDEAMNKLRHTTQRLDPDYDETRLSFS